MTIGLFIGRFQPFHKGHLAIIRKALEMVDEIVLVIGTTQESRTVKNPLTAEEREKIIVAVLQDEGISQYKIFKIEDIPSDDKYVEHVQKHVPPFDVVFSGENELNKKLFSQAGYKVIASERLNGWVATEIRKRIVAGENYSDLVPPKVLEVLKQEGYDKIIQNCS